MESKNNTEVIRADDFVEYFLFPSLDQLSGNDVDEKLNNFSRDVNESVNKFTVDYIWHKEPCQFVPRTPQMRKLLHESNTEGKWSERNCVRGLLMEFRCRQSASALVWIDILRREHSGRMVHRGDTESSDKDLSACDWTGIRCRWRIYFDWSSWGAAELGQFGHLRRKGKCIHMPILIIHFENFSLKQTQCF